MAADIDAITAFSEDFVNAQQLRVPLMHPDSGPRATMALSEQLASYMLLSAWYAGALHEERLGHYVSLRDAQNRWDHLEGWEMYRQGKTDASREEAKKLMDPELYDEIQARKWMISRLSEEIERLNRDGEKAVSRTYTILTGT